MGKILFKPLCSCLLLPVGVPTPFTERRKQDQKVSWSLACGPWFILDHRMGPAQPLMPLRSSDNLGSLSLTGLRLTGTLVILAK